MQSEITVSIIIPAFNASRYLELCLGAVAKSSYQNYEIIVVDDCSDDGTDDIARRHRAEVFRLQSRSGPAAARNYGARMARKDRLCFVDADVLIKPGTLARIVDDFNCTPRIAAVFGSYDDDPPAKNFVSQYKNLQHHFIHQHSNHEAETFWSGCGAIKKEIFQKVDGFDQSRYPKASIEDIELGFRLRTMGYRIILDKDLQVTHLKRWSLISMLKTDILYRAVPWSKLILQSRDKFRDLNLQFSARVSTALAGLSAALFIISIYSPELFPLPILLLPIIFLINYKFYRFLLRRNGTKFVVLSFPLHLLYFFYCGIAFSYRLVETFSAKILCFKLKYGDVTNK